MNTPLLLASVALFAGVATRPIVPIRRGDDLRELARSDDRQAVLSGFDSLNAVQFHNVHGDDTHTSNVDVIHSGSASPKLAGVDGLLDPDPDPGLASPYMGAQRHLSRVEQELRLSPPTLSTSAPPSPAPLPPQTTHTSATPPSSEHSPNVLVLVFASTAALALLGITVILVLASHLLRSVLLRQTVWRRITGGVGIGALPDGGEKTVDDGWSEKGRLIQSNEPSSVERHEASQQRREQSAAVSASLSHVVSSITSPPSESPSEEDPDATALPGHPIASALLLPGTLRQTHLNREMGLAVVGWTYDNWLMHFMMALFGWLGVFFGNAHD